VAFGKGLLWRIKHSKPMLITGLAELVKELFGNNKKNKLKDEP
jgi:hypothetical protein